MMPAFLNPRLLFLAAPLMALASLFVNCTPPTAGPDALFPADPTAAQTPAPTPDADAGNGGSHAEPASTANESTTAVEEAQRTTAPATLANAEPDVTGAGKFETAEDVTAAAVPGPSKVSIAENDYGRMATYAPWPEADPEGIRWSLEGNDAAHFTIDTPPGALRIRMAPALPGLFPTAADYEAPRDAGADNTYDVTVVATAPGGASFAQAVAVTVTDSDETGTITLSTARPRVGEPLTATLGDPDTVTGTVSWTWERSAGRNAWAVIEGATTAQYTPSAADAGEHLRVTARYGDGHGSGRTVVAGLHNVVLADLLSSLTAATGDSAAGEDWRKLRPDFDPRTPHYSVGCADPDAMTLSFAAADGASRLAVGGGAYPNPGAGRPVTATVPVGGRSDVVISVSNGAGGETRYVVHCMDENVDAFTAERSEGATEQLLLVSRNTDLLIFDANAVPRQRIQLEPEGARAYFRFYPDGGGGEYRYSYSLREGRHVVLDQDFEMVDEVTTVEPLSHTGTHDFRVLDSGNYLLMAFEEAARDFSRLTFPNSKGEPFGTDTTATDSAIQVVTPEGEALLTWNSWDHMPPEDCTHHFFPPIDPRWAHVNSIGVYDGEIVASFRGCNRVLGIDPDTGEVNWRVGPTNQDEAGWASPRLDPPPLAIVGDPQGQFCGQHAASITPEGRLLLYDNGANCSRNPWTGENPVRPDRTYSRGVEYHLDFDDHEAVYVREHSLGGTADRIGWYLGHIERLEDGDWLISWGSKVARTGWIEPPYAVNDFASATQVDPATGQESLTLHWQVEAGQDIRVTAMPGYALARQPRTVSAEVQDAATSRFHAGAADRPQVVVTFSHPVADFAASSPSLSVQGATVTAVSPRIVAGEPAHSYVLTLAPHGDGPIAFALLADRPCELGGICAADGTTLSAVPPALAIEAGPAADHRTPPDAKDTNPEYNEDSQHDVHQPPIARIPNPKPAGPSGPPSLHAAADGRRAGCAGGPLRPRRAADRRGADPHHAGQQHREDGKLFREHWPGLV